MIARRDQIPDPASTGVLEPLIEGTRVHANIEPARPVTFYAAAQTDTPFTHMIYIRFLDWVDTSHLIVRDTRRRDMSARREIFRIRRTLEIDGRVRYLQIEAELEQRT